MSLTKIGTQKVVSCHPSDTVLDAARLMRDQGVGAVVVMEGNKPVGILTDRDIIVVVVAAEKNPAKVPCSEIMSRDLVTIYDHQSPQDALRMMADKHVRRLPVIDEHGRCVGIVALDDCLVLLSREINDCTRVVLYERDKARALKTSEA